MTATDNWDIQPKDLPLLRHLRTISTVLFVVPLVRATIGYVQGHDVAHIAINAVFWSSLVGFFFIGWSYHHWKEDRSRIIAGILSSVLANCAVGTFVALATVVGPQQHESGFEMLFEATMSLVLMAGAFSMALTFEIGKWYTHSKDLSAGLLCASLPFGIGTVVGSLLLRRYQKKYHQASA